MFLFITKKNATLFQTRCLYEVRALQMRNGLYQYTLLCKRLLLCKQKKKIPARSLGEKSAHREKLFFLLSNSTKNLHRKRTYGIAFSSDTFFFSPSLHRVRIKEKKRRVGSSNSRWIFLGKLCLQKQDVHKYFHGRPARHLQFSTKRK